MAKREFRHHRRGISSGPKLFQRFIFSASALEFQPEERLGNHSPPQPHGSA
jgi:hypothetical protein